jgi:putative transposase
MKKLTTFKKGTEAYLHGRRCQILGTAGSRSVRVIYVDGGETVRTDIDNLWVEPPEVEGQLPSIDILHPKSLEVAEYRYSIIEPVLTLINRPENDQSLSDLFTEIQAKHGHSRATLYRWINRYLMRGLLSDLAPRNRKRHRRRLDSKLDEIIEEELKVILAGKRRTLQKMHRNVADQCRQLGLRVPGISTIRQRVKALPPRAIVAARLGPKAAHDMYDQILKQYPGATYPLAFVQIDHTLLDITIVSGRDRLPIGKVWLTVAIDVYSRMIVGIYVSLEATKRLFDLHVHSESGPTEGGLPSLSWRERQLAGLGLHAQPSCR